MFEKVLKRIARSLASYHIPYMIIGGQAVLLYGEPRLTRDIDITLGMGIDEVQTLVQVMKKAEIKVLPEDPADFVRKTWVLPGEDPETKIRVDFIFSFTPYEEQAIKRAKKVILGGASINFASPEDVITHKLFAGRARDLEDVISVLLKNPKIDKTYINKWLKEFDKLDPQKNLSALFKKCIKQAS